MMRFIQAFFAVPYFKKNKIYFELILASLLWGFSFVAMTWILRELAGTAILFYRFFGAFFLGLLFCFFYKNKNQKKESLNVLFYFKISFIPGLLLFLTIWWQTIGLELTSTSQTALITCLYVVFVPILEVFFLKMKLPKSHFFYVILSLIGVAMITQFGYSKASWGDFLVFLSALTSTFQIISIEKKTTLVKNPLLFNSFQSFWIAFFALFIGKSFDLLVPFKSANHLLSWNLFELSLSSWFFFLILTLGVSLYAFTIQMKAQKAISPSTVSLFFLLEAPFALGFSFLLLGEKLNLHQWLGAAIVLFSCWKASSLKKVEK